MGKDYKKTRKATKKKATKKKATKKKVIKLYLNNSYSDSFIGKNKDEIRKMIKDADYGGKDTIDLCSEALTMLDIQEEGVYVIEATIKKIEPTKCKCCGHSGYKM